MPIYEFYCADCHTLFNFFSARVDTETRPACPRCGRAPLERRPARFATPRRAGAASEGPEGLDESALEGAMESLAREAEAAGESDDPRVLAKLFRRFGEASGMELGPRMEGLLERLEAGEDPDRLEDELGDELDGDESVEEFFRVRRGGAASRRRRPTVDGELYFL